METVDWSVAIERYRGALQRIVAALFDLVGVTDGGIVATLPRRLRNRVNRILRPAESAVRRLIVVAARDLVVELDARARKPDAPVARRKPSATGIVYPPGFRPDPVRKAAPRGLTIPALPLIDPRKRFSFDPPRRRPKGYPRISVPGVTEPRPVPDGWIPSPEDEVGAESLCRRLAALKRALDDLDGHAMRLARWKARRELGLLRCPRASPMRPGRPPGYRKRSCHEVDDVLRECHSLALYAERRDSS